MQFHVLASGSKGNSTFIFDEGIGILIDCGISRKQLLYKLNNLGFNENNINYVLNSELGKTWLRIFLLYIRGNV